MAAILLTSLCACSNSELEKKINGTWKTHLNTVEDGINVNAEMIENYNFETHEYTSEIKYSVGAPLDVWMYTVSYKGKWSISGDKLLGQIDEKSLDFKFNTTVLEPADQREIRRELSEELKNQMFDGGVISDVTEDSFILTDEDDNSKYTYTRIK